MIIDVFIKLSHLFDLEICCRYGSVWLIDVTILPTAAVWAQCKQIKHICLYVCSTINWRRFGLGFLNQIHDQNVLALLLFKLICVEINKFTIFEHSLIYDDETASTKLPHQKRHVDGPDPITRPHRSHRQSGHRGIQATVRLSPSCGK